MKRTLILLLCLALTGCRGKKEEPASPVVTVDVAPVLLSQIQQTVRADGVVYPKQQAAIVPKVAAPIRKALVQRGAKVKAGQLLIELENQDLAGAATESRATYEGWVREAESRINWGTHIDFIYDLIRGCNPAPGAWTTAGERKLYLFDARKITAPTFGAVRGRKIGEVVSVGEAGMRILAQGGFVEVSRVRLDDGAKIAATDAGIAEGTVLGG